MNACFSDGTHFMEIISTSLVARSLEKAAIGIDINSKGKEFDKPKINLSQYITELVRHTIPKYKL